MPLRATSQRGAVLKDLHRQVIHNDSLVMRGSSSGCFRSTRQHSEVAWEGQRLLGGLTARLGAHDNGRAGGDLGAVGVRSQGIEVVDKGGVLSPLLIIGFRQRDRFHLLYSPTHFTLTQCFFQGKQLLNK